MAEEIVQRLENVVNKLDKTGGADDGGPPPAVQAYDAFYKDSVQPFIDSCGNFEELKKVGEWTATAFGFLKTVLEASAVSAKPSDEDFMKFLAPIVQVITDSSNPNNRSAFFSHEKSFAECITSLSWIMQPGPADFVKGQLEAADFYMTKVLTGCKDMEDPAKTNHRTFRNSLKKLMEDQSEFCKEWYKGGIVWKFKGGSLAEYKPGQGSAGGASEGKKSVDERLEALAIRLERLAAKSADSADGTPAYVAAYDAFIKDCVDPLVATCATFPELKEIGEGIATAYAHQRKVLLAQNDCKKPSDENFLKFLDPIVQVITKSSNTDNRSKFFNHQKAFNETIQGLSWLMMPGGKAFIEGQLGASDFYLMKILTTAKDMEDPAKTNHRNFVNQLKAMMNGLAEFSQEWFKMGLAWNPKGQDLLAWKEK